MRQVGAALLIYANNNRGWIVPVGEWDGKQYESLGTNVEPFQRWPAVVFDLGPLPAFPVDDPAVYRPAILVCPVDEEPTEAHSYILNKHLAHDPADVKKYGSRIGHGKSVSDVALLGEKFEDVRDYYMEKEPGLATEFTRVVDDYKHGRSAGANYLFMDLHVGRQTPAKVLEDVDPWEVPREGE
jgi:prepilin-type processing-associated H-X9-DG protein